MTAELRVVYGYGRGSTDKQQITIENQEESCKRYFDNNAVVGGKFHGMVWGGFYPDSGVTGKIPWFERPAGEVLFRRLRPGDHVVIFKWSRASRRVFNLLASVEKLKEAKVSLHSVHEGLDLSTPMGRLMLTIMGAVAEMEQESISENTRVVMQRRKRMGLPTGHASLAPTVGWKVVGKKPNTRFVPDNRMRRWGLWVIKQRKEGRTFADISKYFRRNRITTTGGCELRVEPVKRLYCYARLNWPHIRERDIIREFCLANPGDKTYTDHINRSFNTPRPRKTTKAMKD